MTFAPLVQKDMKKAPLHMLKCAAGLSVVNLFTHRGSGLA